MQPLHVQIGHTSSQSQLNELRMAKIGKSGALCTINLNEHSCDEERQLPAQIRLRMELLVMTLEDMETQRQRLQTELSKFLTVNQLKKMVDGHEQGSILSPRAWEVHQRSIVKFVVMNSDRLTVERGGMMPERNRYRLTFRDDHGRMRVCEVTASSMSIALYRER
jgi:hypothetical protein